MLLYHGTNETVARTALIAGLMPRGWRDGGSTWEGCPSSPDCVYLTTAYAGYFAMNATEADERWGIVEIDTDLIPEDFGTLVPDEDFLEQATRGQETPPEWGLPTEGMEARTAWFRDHLYSFAHLWDKSIEGLGNCAYQGAVPPSAITRVGLFTPASNPSLAMMIMDPMITLMNYRICGPKHRALVQWLMGDTVDPTDIDLFSNLTPFQQDGIQAPPEVRKALSVHEERAQQLRDMLAMRDGLEVLRGRE